LKTLEEPPEKTIFILLVENRANLLETIQSRAFEIRLRPLDQGQALHEGLQEIQNDLKGKRWEDFFEEYASSSRIELGEVFDHLMVHFRNQLKEQTSSARNLKAIDLLLESKEALEANGNQKLILSRLSMQLKQTVPERNQS
jgi:hypothetical protein